MKNYLHDLEKEFDKAYNIHELVDKELDEIQNYDWAVYDEFTDTIIEDIKKSKIKYVGKKFLINDCCRRPYFVLYFILLGSDNTYLYESEYNLSGEFSDEFFSILEDGEENKWI